MGTGLECVMVGDTNCGSRASRGKGRHSRHCVKVVLHEQVHGIIPYVAVGDAAAPFVLARNHGGDELVR